MKPHRPYQLSEYDPEWKRIFAKNADALRTILGENLVDIEHIGSTSIEGVVAKPQIDILAVVKDLRSVPGRYEALKTAGYTPRGTEYVRPGNEYVTKDAPDDRRLVSIHILQEGDPEIKDLKAFRDYLRTDKKDRDLYVATKRRLYALHRDDYAAYDRGKEEMVAAIIDRAKKWAAKKDTK